MELDTILNGQEPEEPVTSEALAPEPEQDETDNPSQPRDPHGRFAPKGETETPATPDAAPPAAQDEPPPWKGQIEERRKRQDAEARLAQLEQELAQLRQAPPQQHQPEPQYQQPDEIPRVYEDDFAQGLLEEAVRIAEQRLAPRMQTTRADLMVEMAKGRYPDYPEVENKYRDLITQNPALHHEVMRQPNPVEYAYQLTKKHMEFQQRGATNVDELKAQLRAEIEAEMRGPQATTAPQTIPSSLADTQSARGSTGSQGPPTLNDILGRK